MIISRERMTLVSEDVNGVLGNCIHFDSDWSISALVRAVAIKYGDVDVENLAKGTRIEKRRARNREELNFYLSDPYFDEVLTVVECINCIDEEIDAGSEWESEFTFGGKPFPVSQYLSQFGKTKIFMSIAKKRLVAFVDRRATNVWIQALESVMCRLMPWYYPVDLPEEEQKFYRAIAVDNKAVTPEEKVEIFVSYVNEVAKSIDFRSLKLHKLLDGVADRARRSRISSLTTLVANARSHIERIMRDLANNYATLDSNLLELRALENAEPESNDAMFTFFNNHKQVHLLDVYDNSLTFGVDDTLEFYDEDEFSRLLENRRSFLHDYDDVTRKCLKAIFGDRRGVLRVNAMFDLQQFKLVHPRQNENFIDDSLPNPHIYFFGCSGGNGQYYSQYAANGDWDLGIEQAISATKNLNWGDSTVCERMIRWILNNGERKFVYVADDFKPIEKVTPEMKLVTFNEFAQMVHSHSEGEKADG